MPQSDQSPFPLSDLLDAEGGLHAGDPVYLLSNGTYGGRVAGLLWRSLDEGQSWQQVALGFQWPTHLPPSHRPGFLFVPASDHSVAPAFAAAYRRLGPGILGLPLTEAHYTNQGVYRQDFERLRLELRQGRVVVAPLGLEEAAARHLRFAAIVLPVDPVHRYFKSTGHSLSGVFLDFWQTHGGQSIFGAPLSEVQQAHDARGSTYLLQWFENARLEYGLSSEGSQTVTIAPLGRESLVRRGWLP